VVGLNWLWSYLTFERGARLITGASSEATGAAVREGPPAARRAAA
jgi:NADH dehydrogenase